MIADSWYVACSEADLEHVFTHFTKVYLERTAIYRFLPFVGVAKPQNQPSQVILRGLLTTVSAKAETFCQSY